MAGPGVDLVQLVIDRSAVSVNEDVAVITMHCRGMVAGLPDELNPMDNTNRNAFASRVDDWWTIVKDWVDSKHVLKGIRFYALESAPGVPMGPPDLALVRNVPGTSTPGNTPTQVACSVTFITDNRKTWGRFYLPGMAPANFSNYRFVGGLQTAIANATHGLTARSGTGACLTVWSRTGWTHHDPQFIQVDDVPDVIRSRRLSNPISRVKIAAG